MLNKNKTKVIVSAVIILLPMLFGLILWEQLPESMISHWGPDGTADGFTGKALVILGQPLLFLALHFLALVTTALDKRQKEQSPKALGIIFWIMPMISLFISCITYSAALGRNTDISILLPVLLGVSFILMGNYLPKIKQNSTLGIKISWTLQNEENWNKTHRFGGKVMVVGGFLLLASAALPLEASVIAFIGVMVGIAVLPFAYSYRIYRRHQKEGVEYRPRARGKAEKLSILVLVILLLGLAVILFVGDVTATCQDTSLQLQATFWTDIQVDYAKIDTIAYRTDLELGTRTNGFSSARLLLGIFQNQEFGPYTLYAYTGAEAYIVLTSEGKTLVIGLQDTQDTQALFDAISGKVSA